MAVLVKINRRSNVSEFFSFVALPQRYSDQQQSQSQKLEFGIQYLMDGGTLNIKKWVVMYPVYINSKKSVAEGRRISLSKACENPNCIEITDCCKHLKLPSAVEVKKKVICNDGTVAAPSDSVARKSSNTVARKSSDTVARTLTDTVAENQESCSSDAVVELL
ncbi:PREDICTED: uncharacterized protein LOC106314627 [Brassica oleracea var. oleracea]|uniref:uncharacterized protein LOC106314627 n=1 Tax=Brassica oleracea var. oleracea TaxID=109376 RepID=UPI0006A6B3F6|nr:PREDICTED: uncharacterized protein LOC106314627 [Brassica oleracea var. oleracea]